MDVMIYREPESKEHIIKLYIQDGRTYLLDQYNQYTGKRGFPTNPPLSPL